MAAKFQKLEAQYEHLLSEYNILKCKLECKTESLLILSQEQAQCRSERDQYKLMADQLRERYSTLKKRVEGWGPSLLGVYDIHGLKGEREQSLVQLLCDLKEQNKLLQQEVDDLTQKLADSHGDIKIMKEQMKRSRLNSESSLNSIQFSTSDRESLVTHLESYQHKCNQLERDLQALLDEKEELVTARDAFRHKFERLNQQMNCLLRGDQNSYVDVDGVVMENRYLQERIKQTIEEKNLATVALTKCKALLEKKRSSGFKLSSIAAGIAISAKQVEQLLQNNHFLEKANDSSTSSDVRNFVLTLLEALSDNSIALSHQKKTNKILGQRVHELEQKVKDMQATTLWQVHDTRRLSYLLKTTQSEETDSCENPTPHATPSSTGGQRSYTPNPSESEFEEQVISISKDGSEFEKDEPNFSDLDLLPTKDISLSGYERCSKNICTGSLCNSKSSTPFSSPLHRTRSVCSDSSLSPKRPLRSIPQTSDNPTMDLDDLPPKLQKLLAAALSDIENGRCDPQKEEFRSFNLEGSIKENDPNC